MAISNNTPVMYDFINLYNADRNPSAIHTKNTGLFEYYGNYLFKKVLSVIDFDGLPETWESNYFKYILFGEGFITVFKHDQFGVIPQNCTVSDNFTIFYQPKFCIIANPVLKGSLTLEIGKDCELVRLQPDYRSVIDLVSFYADMLAVASETAAVNLLNSKVSFIFFAKNKAVAETYKRLYDEISSGKPFAVIDKDLINEDGSHDWDFFQQSVGQNYIVAEVLDDMKTIEDQFNTKIGIPNANTQKRERLISSEVEANDIDTRSLIDVWLDTLNRDLKKVNEHYGLNITAKYRYADFFEKGASDESNTVDTGSL